MKKKCIGCGGSGSYGTNLATNRNRVCPVCRGSGSLTPTRQLWLQEYHTGASRFLERFTEPPSPISQMTQYAGYVAMKYSFVVDSATMYDTNTNGELPESLSLHHPDWKAARLRVVHELKRIKSLREQNYDS